MSLAELLTTRALAAAPIITPAGNLTAGGKPPEQVVTNVYNTAFDFLMLIAGGLAVLYIMWMGIQIITAGGDAAKVKSARSGIINAVIGIIVILAAFFIVRFAVGLGNTVANAS